LRYGVLCRFTAYVAIDSEVATDGSAPHEVTQLVEPPMDWMDQEAPRGLSRMRSPHARPAGAPAQAASMTAAVAMPSAPSMPKRAARISFAAQEDAATHVVDHASMVREQAATEARLLRESATEPAFRRRDLLDDLASRLDALLLHVQSTASDSDKIAAALHALIAVLRDEKADLDERWARALTLLDELADESAPESAPESTPRQHFWKRG
jgi:Ca-activated chloride channel family protein